MLEKPLDVTRGAASWIRDLALFRRHAAENRRLHAELAKREYIDLQRTELALENARLTRLLEMRQAVPPQIRRTVSCRVIARSPSRWNRTWLLDKGTRDGIRVNMLVVADFALAGKVIEAGPTVSKVMLVNDPNMRIGAIVQRTRHQGVLYGTPEGECRLKYLPLDARLKAADIVETAGLGGFFAKGLVIGKVDRVWKEPGVPFLVARVRPAADLSRVEEVLCVE